MRVFRFLSFSPILNITNHASSPQAQQHLTTPLIPHDLYLFNEFFFQLLCVLLNYQKNSKHVWLSHLDAIALATFVCFFSLFGLQRPCPQLFPLEKLFFMLKFSWRSQLLRIARWLAPLSTLCCKGENVKCFCSWREKWCSLSQSWAWWWSGGSSLPLLQLALLRAELIHHWRFIQA